MVLKILNDKNFELSQSQDKRKRTYSVNLCSWLVSRGFEFECKLDENNKDIAYFVFEDTPEVAEEIKKYKYNNPELHEFISAFKQVKQAITKAKEQG